jgi:F0F1-type ATP synthase membrane subunit c/vacuolar-type H+-ATPase subunit K
MLYKSLQLVGAGVAIVSICGSGVGIGILFGCFLIALSHSPNNEEKLFSYVVLGFALTEAIALMGVMVSMTILFKNA